MMKISENTRSLFPLWRLGFRPFFLAGASFATLAILLWLAFLGGHLGWQPAGGMLAWHRHEMMFGFAVAIVAGFLLTAVQNWTATPGLTGRPLALLAGLWLAARLLWLVDTPLWLLIPVDAAFLPLTALAVGRQIVSVKQTRNYPVPGLLLLMAAANGLTLTGLALGDDDWQRQGVHAGLWLVAAMMGLIGGRVIPFFTQRGLLRQTQAPAILALDRTAMASAVLDCRTDRSWLLPYAGPVDGGRLCRHGHKHTDPAGALVRSRHLERTVAVVAASGVFLAGAGASGHGAVAPRPDRHPQPAVTRPHHRRHERPHSGHDRSRHPGPHRSPVAAPCRHECRLHRP
jgi:hypothetical protein